MNKNDAYKLFQLMVDEAKDELLNFTLNSGLTIDQKADKSAVTECDKRIDNKLSTIAKKSGLQIISEEGKLVQNIVESGNYITIDPIDGTLGYIDYVNNALNKGNINNFLHEDLGPQKDFCLLIGIVENNTPLFGACYNYITKEKIFIDGSNKDNLIRKNNKRRQV